ncbi:unnamed protein product [Lactuca saligna]|uniref:non-specific serine/threonine protein kinase n=1 Tax=Lactuca saligna TaxID=75948 RepID=A0AA35YTE1_LACSI|nr:unnamed protein product [Lactuca saligna]
MDLILIVMNLQMTTIKRALQDDNEPNSVQIIYKLLSRKSKKKLEELLHQWSEWHTLECSLSELTNFGLSKVGLINSKNDVSGPAVSGTSLLDYLAPKILLGNGHGILADWWSVGVILFELIVGIPPFNAEHPQMIFDNILNLQSLCRLLKEDPNQRLGARGATEVKQHPYFRDINWDTLSRKKAAFVPSSESALDTSYFTSRYTWNNSEQVRASSLVLGFVCTFLFNSSKQTHKKHSIFPITFKVYNVGMEATVVLQLKEDVLEYFRQQR